TGPCGPEGSVEPRRPGTPASNILCSETCAQTDEERGDPSADEGLVQHAREEEARRCGEDEPAGGLCGDSKLGLGAGILSRASPRSSGPHADLRSWGRSNRSRSG